MLAARITVEVERDIRRDATLRAQRRRDMQTATRRLHTAI
jgi:hypothetical protein